MEGLFLFKNKCGGENKCLMQITGKDVQNIGHRSIFQTNCSRSHLRKHDFQLRTAKTGKSTEQCRLFSAPYAQMKCTLVFSSSADDTTLFCTFLPLLAPLQLFSIDNDPDIVV